MYNMKAYVKFFDGCQIGNRIYFFNMTFNAIFYLDINKLTIHYVDKISDENRSKTALSTGMNFVDKEVVYFLPDHSNGIFKCDTKKKKSWKIPIRDSKKNFFQTIAYICMQNEIFIFPYELKQGIYVFDMQDESVEKDEELSRLFSSGMFCANVYLIQENCAVICISGSNNLIELDLKKKTIMKKIFLPNQIKIENICFDGYHYWILQRESTDIYECDKKYNILQKYVNTDVEWSSKEYTISSPYSTLIFLRDEILVLNCCLKNILKINKEKRTIEDVINFPETFQFVNKNFAGWPICYGSKIIGNKVFLFPCRGNMLLIYDADTKKLTGKEMLVCKEDVPYLEDVVEEIFSNIKVSTEKDDLETLQNYIYMIGKMKRNVQPYDGGLVGEKVFNRLKEK